MDEQYDVVVVGGGAAGLSGALALAGARRSVLVIDAGQPRNAPAGHVHNYLGPRGHATGRAARDRPRRGRRVRRRRSSPAGSTAVERDGTAASGSSSTDGGRVSGPAAAGHHRAGRRAARRARPRRALGPRRPALPLLPRLGGPRPGRSASWRPGRWRAPGADVAPAERRRRRLPAHRPGARPTTSASSWPPAGIRGRRRRGGRAGGRRRPARPACGWPPARWSPRDAVVVAPRFTARADCSPRSGCDRCRRR